MNWVNGGDRLAMVNDGKFESMNGAVSSIAVEGHEHFWQQLMVVEGNIEFYKLLGAIRAMPAELFSLID